MTAVAPVRAAVVAALTGAGLSVYANKGPGSPESAVPYVVVYTQMPTYDGPAADPNADATVTVQVKAVGNGPGSAETIGDKARAVMLAGITPPSGYVHQAPTTSEGGQSAAPDDDTTGPLWMSDELFVLTLTPVTS